MTAPGPGVPIDRKVDFLRERAFPGEAVEVIETHMSWVFLTGTRVYKLKKPKRMDFLDYSSLEARHRDCEAEVRLNQELAPGVYLDVVPLVSSAGDLQIGGEGVVQDWLVVMRRLPVDQMLDQRLRLGPVSYSELQDLTAVLVRFHRGADRVPMEAAEYRFRLEAGLRTNGEMLTRRRFGLPAEEIDAGLDVLIGWIDRSEILGYRATKLVDGHGDLRAEHVVLGPEVLVIDRLSFSADLRITDPLHEVCMLAVECERLGASQVARTLLDQYSRLASEAGPPALMSFYAADKALLRARLSIAHALDPGADLVRWQGAARTYLDIANAQLDLLRARS